MLSKYFDIYTETQAPFLHKMRKEWSKMQPFTGLSALHHLPLLPNTMLKIACLVEGGAKITVTNPGFMKADTDAIKLLQDCGIRYIDSLAQLKNETFDLYFDCGAELYQALGAPNIGAIELTATGDHYYRAQTLTFPVVSIDTSLIKQLETVFGASVSAAQAITQLTAVDVTQKKWLIFGFGKIGRGLAYYCAKNNITFTVAEICSTARSHAKALDVNVIDVNNFNVLEQHITAADIIITATGEKAMFDSYPKAWFSGKILAQMGITDEYGDRFRNDEVLNDKSPINFALKDATPIEYIDPALYAHNIAALDLLTASSPIGVSTLPKDYDQKIIHDWTQFHGISREQIDKWFVK